MKINELLNKNIDCVYNSLIDTQDYIQSMYNQNDASEADILNKINNNINKTIRRVEMINEILGRKKGCWIDTDNYFYRWKCSKCGYHTRDAEPNYCPNCGVEMNRGE